MGRHTYERSENAQVTVNTALLGKSFDLSSSLLSSNDVLID